MSKLGYTWYPKDWGNSEAVFELNLTERGLYRELIDLGMLNDNKTIINLSVWSRKWDLTEDELKSLLGGLSLLYLIEVNGKDLFIPSCEARLNLVRGGKKGGQKSRKDKPTPKPLVSLSENNGKPTPKQIEKKGKEIKRNKQLKEDLENNFINLFNKLKKDIGMKSNIKALSKTDKNNLKQLRKSYGRKDFVIAINNMLKSKWPKDNNQQVPSHILRVDNFNKYLEMGAKKELTLPEKLSGKS